jgi:hypothetical protein
MSTIVLHPARAPRTAPAFGAAVPSFLQRLWAALEVHGQRRAALELRRVADRHAYGDPVIAGRLLEAAASAEAAANEPPAQV